MTWHHICDTCGKRAFLSKHEARKARKGLPRHGGMSVYECGGYFHIGHLPHAVRRGRVTRSEIYGEREVG